METEVQLYAVVITGSHDLPKLLEVKREPFDVPKHIYCPVLDMAFEIIGNVEFRYATQSLANIEGSAEFAVDVTIDPSLADKTE